MVKLLSVTTEMSCFTLTVVDDSAVEGTEDLTLELRLLSFVTVTLNPSQLTVTITDNDEGVIAVFTEFPINNFSPYNCSL